MYRRMLGIALIAFISGSALAGKDSKSAQKATASLEAAPEHPVKGTVTFSDSKEGTEVKIDVKGLKPDSVHAIHIHENGKCEKPKFESAGGHFNPTNEPHAHPGTKEHHLGDLGNIVADKDGNAKKDVLIRSAKLSGKNSPLGKAVILHEKADDLRSQPTGNAGGRIACGVITSK